MSYWPRASRRVSGHLRPLLHCYWWWLANKNISPPKCFTFKMLQANTRLWAHKISLSSAWPSHCMACILWRLFQTTQISTTFKIATLQSCRFKVRIVLIQLKGWSHYLFVLLTSIQTHVNAGERNCKLMWKNSTFRCIPVRWAVNSYHVELCDQLKIGLQARLNAWIEKHCRNVSVFFKCSF